jgi:DnaJ-domain-containing protein 1
MVRHSPPPPLRTPGAPEAQMHACDIPGCPNVGEYRAPRGRDELSRYYLFCLDHVRAYNASWNYFAGMSEAEMEAQIRADTTWQRPSWPFGAWRGGRRNGAPHFSDPFDLFGGEHPSAGHANGAAGEGRGWQARRETRLSEKERALAVMQLSAPATVAAIKMRYKELVKRHHPDANGGDRASEERLKVINQAYSTLMSRGSAT